MPQSGVSSPGRHVDTAPADQFDTRTTVPSVTGDAAYPSGARPAVLRFSDGLTPKAYYRTAEIAYARGLLRPERFRLLDFLQRQELDLEDGRVIGMRHTDQVSGGEDLARRYGKAHKIGSDRFWADIGGLYRDGWAEKVVKPAPGRRAVYALCLRADAIPGDLPEDLARELRVWDLPEAEDPHQDAAYGRLTSRPAPEAEPHVAQAVRPEETPRMAAEFAAAARWQHPAGSRAAELAASIYADAKRLGMVPADDAPEDVERPRKASLDLRCTVVADRDRAAEMTARIQRLQHRLMTLDPSGKPSPLYARGFDQLFGAFSTGSSDLSPSKMATAKTTPSAAPTKRPGGAFGDDLATIARAVMRRVWSAWRRELGRSEVFLPQPSPEEFSRSVTGSTWEDLHRTVAIALRRGGTETQLVELLTLSIVRRDQWGRIVAKPGNVGRLAAWRLWQFIRSHENPHFAKRRHVEQAEHVTWWDETTPAQREAYRHRAEQRRDEHKDREAARLQQAADEWADKRQRWGLDRFEQPAATEPQAEPRRWAQQPEHVHLQELAGQRDALPSRSSRKADAEWRAAVAQARRDKRARRAREGQ